MIKQVSEEVFKDTKGVSYSRLSNLAGGPQAYQAGLVDDPESSAISLGSAVDILLTAPDTFDEQIYVMTTSKPSSDMMQRFVNKYLETDDKEKAWVASGFKIGVDAAWKKFEKEGKPYYDAIQAADGRQILDAEDRFKANQIVTMLQTNPFTKKYFVPEDGVELLFQPRILWDLKFYSKLDENLTSIPAKSILDVIRIDHKEKKIQPIDLKTGAESFMKSFWRWRRDLQGSMYQSATLQSIQESDVPYTVDNMRFVYADTNMYYPPRIYRMTDNDIAVGKSGKLQRTFNNYNETPSFGYLQNNYKVKGYTQLAAELEWHQKMDKWEYSYDLYQSNGEVDIDAFSFKF
jgi:hypothetical protein